MDNLYTLYNSCKSVPGIACLIISLLLASPGFAQQATGDTVITSSARESYIQNDTTFHSPKKAAIYSAVLPGLGQIYNRKYWKLPFVYAGFGTFGYFISFNDNRFKKFKQAYKDFPDYNLNYPYPLSLEQIDKAMYYYKRWRDLSILGTFGFYLFQIIDATVDAHLFNWEVGEDLSININPSFNLPPVNNGIHSFGLRACLSF